MAEAPILTPKQRRQRNRDEMMTAIVQTARDVMREQGVAALNLNEIARRLKMQTPSLYEYFPNKMALYDHLFLLGTRQFRHHMNEMAAQPAQTPWDRVERLLTAHLQFAIDHPDLFKLVFERHVPGFVPSDESMVEARSSLAEADSYLLAVLREIGLDPGDSLDTLRDFFIAIMHGISSQHLANEPHLPVGQGRFGSLIPFIISVLKKAWEPTN